MSQQAASTRNHGITGGRGSASRSGRGSGFVRVVTKDIVTKSFRGNADDNSNLSGHVFDMGKPQHAELYQKTKKEVISYIRQKYKEVREDMVASLEMERKVLLEKPDPSNDLEDYV